MGRSLVWFGFSFLVLPLVLRKFLQETSSLLLCAVAGQRDHKSDVAFYCWPLAPFGVGAFCRGSLTHPVFLVT